MIKIYLAGRYERREELASYGRMLEYPSIKELKEWDGEGFGRKYQITSRWLSSKQEDPCVRILGAEQDLQDVEEADWLVFFSEKEDVGYLTGGRHVEFGYFLGLMSFRGTRKIFVISPPNVPDGYKENIFHHLLPEGAFYKSFEDWVERYVRFV